MEAAPIEISMRTGGVVSGEGLPDKEAMASPMAPTTDPIFPSYDAAMEAYRSGDLLDCPKFTYDFDCLLPHIRSPYA